MGAEEYIVTCARTRGSRMKLFPVAAATAWTICVMSASLKFGVMLTAWCTAPCACAWQAIGGTSRARQHANARKPFTNLNPPLVGPHPYRMPCGGENGMERGGGAGGPDVPFCGPASDSASCSTAA